METPITEPSINEWEDVFAEISEGKKFVLSTLWLLPKKMAVIVSGINNYAKPGQMTLLCPALGLHHAPLKATTSDEAKLEAIEILKATLTTYGNALRAYMKQINNG